MSKLGENIFAWLTIIRAISFVFPDPAGRTTERKQCDWVLLRLFITLESVKNDLSKLTRELVSLMWIYCPLRKIWGKLYKKMTRNKIFKWWINKMSKDQSSFKSSPPQTFKQNGGCSWLFPLKTRRSMLHWEMFAESGSSTICCPWSTQSSL